jgi:hypothetical protein
MGTHACTTLHSVYDARIGIDETDLKDFHDALVVYKKAASKHNLLSETCTTSLSS